MANNRRIARLQSLIQARVAEVLQRELKDPRLGLVTIQGVQLDRELTLAKVYWSVIGQEGARRTNERALAAATKFIQREVAAIMPTRNSPRLEFVFDESIEGAIRIEKLLKDVLPADKAADTDGPSESDAAKDSDEARPEDA